MLSSFSSWSKAHDVSGTIVKQRLRNAPRNTCRPKMPKMVKKKTHKSMTLAIIGTARIIVPIKTRIPGNMESDRSGRRTRITRRALTFPPIPGSRLTRLTKTTMKSMTFHPSLR